MRVEVNEVNTNIARPDDDGRYPKGYKALSEVMWEIAQGDPNAWHYAMLGLAEAGYTHLPECDLKVIPPALLKTTGSAGWNSIKVARNILYETAKIVLEYLKSRDANAAREFEPAVMPIRSLCDALCVANTASHAIDELTAKLAVGRGPTALQSEIMGTLYAFEYAARIASVQSRCARKDYQAFYREHIVRQTSEMCAVIASRYGARFWEKLVNAAVNAETEACDAI